MNEETNVEQIVISEEEWNKIYEDAIDIWNKLDVPKNSNIEFETNNRPMHPNMFFHLSSVSGFNNMNGHTYEEYVVSWKTRCKKNV